MEMGSKQWDINWSSIESDSFRYSGTALGGMARSGGGVDDVMSQVFNQ